MKLIFAFIFLIHTTSTDTNHKELASTYISQFKDIAVEEMHRTGIPASIKLAQGLLESDWGRSDLAKDANNHFGIKCGGTWHGETFYKKDDDKDAHGRTIESCFRAFNSPIESYMAHSDFLTDPRKEYRYGFLFEYDSNDYVSWAKGLKKSGYATDPNYPNKLISIIEKYHLDQFDTHSKSESRAYTYHKKIQAKRKKTSNRVTKSSKRNNKREREKVVIEDARENAPIQRMPEKYISRLKYDIQTVNNCRMVKAKGGETIEELSRAVGISENEIININEIYQNPDHLLAPDEYIFLEKKKRSYREGKEFHQVREGETMESIAQRYGIRLKSLYAKNRMPKNSTTIPGVILSIRNTVGLDERPQFRLSNSNRKHNFLFEEDDSVK